jgi:hemerythrin-like domain-containing protein
VATANGPYADTRDLRGIHTVFRREFGLTPALVRSVTAGDTERSQVLADHIAFMNALLHHHHASEDKTLWPLLLARREQEVAAIVQRIEHQHETLDEMIAEIDQSMKNWQGSVSVLSGEALAGALERMIPPLNEHLDLEEDHILPVVESCITASEWNSIVQDGATDAPQGTLLLSFGMMIYETEPEVIEQLLALMPPDARPLMMERASQAFASHSQRVHGTATPPRSKVGLRLDGQAERRHAQ